MKALILVGGKYYLLILLFNIDVYSFSEFNIL